MGPVQPHYPPRTVMYGALIGQSRTSVLDKESSCQSIRVPARDADLQLVSGRYEDVGAGSPGAGQ